jgi:hypothetical protein
MTDKQIKEMEPRILNSVVYRYVGIENNARKQERLLAEEPQEIKFVDYYEALETCKNLAPETIKKITAAHEKALQKYNEIFDTEVGRLLMSQVHCL